MDAPESQTLSVLLSDPDTILVPSGANATDLTPLLWASVISPNSPSVAARQANPREFRREGGADWRTPRCAPESQTLIVPSRDPETILVPSGENATEKIILLWASAFSLSRARLSGGQDHGRQFRPRRGGLRARGAPVSISHTLRARSAPTSQTLIVMSADPETILVPSGENATDTTALLWASVFPSTCPTVAASRISNTR